MTTPPGSQVPARPDTDPELATLLAGLQPAQREAVVAEDDVVCVLAGAGTGKTRVLTLRVARRALDRTAHPSHVLVCTFSRKAAEELGDRLWALGVGGDVYAGTFHRTALRLIRQQRADRGARPPVVLTDRRSLVAAVAEGRPSRGTRGARVGRGAVGAGIDIARLEAEIGWAKARLVAPDAYEEAARRAGRRSSIAPGRVAELYAAYEQGRRRRGVLDLDDLLLHCADLLENDATFAAAVRWRHRHLFVDEMQDLNEAQFRLLRLLAGDDPDLFVVGDPNQSVYAWNGADPGLLDRLPGVFPGARVMRLDANHRCTPQIVRAATTVLEDGHTQPAVSTRPDGPVPRVVRLGTDADEAAWVARQVWLAHRPGWRWSDIAVLARTNAQLTLVADALAAERVPHRTAGADLAPASDIAGASQGTVAWDAASGDRDGPDEDEDLGVRTDGVVLATFHRAKGLQWPAVFVIGLSDGLVPLVSARTPAARAEERRLLYVALTRAEDELTCTWAAHPHARSAAEAPGREPCPWLAGVESVVAELAREAAVVADPARAAEHLARIRSLLGASGGAA